LTFAALLLGETLQSVQLMGGALIIASVLLLQVRWRKPVPAVGD
jgi:drug/metabolite transporter (DMT)-like permease